eukprot:2865412-Amphidinium_carterae.1
MTKWYGECALVKLDVTAAFDTAPWDKLYDASVANAVPAALATTASWKWAPCLLRNVLIALVLKPFGFDENLPTLLHNLFYADDIYVLITTWTKALVAVRCIKNKFNGPGQWGRNGFGSRENASGVSEWPY